MTKGPTFGSPGGVLACLLILSLEAAPIDVFQTILVLAVLTTYFLLLLEILH